MRFHQLLFCSVLISTSYALADPPQSSTVEELIDSLKSNDLVGRRIVFQELAKHRDAAEDYAPQLREQLRHGDQPSRQQAAMALAALGVDEPAVDEELLAGMGQRTLTSYLSQPEKARSFMAALVMLGQRAVPELIKAAEDDRYPGRDLALEALGEIGPAAREALPLIERLIATDDLPAFCQAVLIKWQIDGDSAFAIDQMVPLLDHEQGRDYHTAVRTLVRMGPDAKTAVPALVSALKKHRDSNLLWAVGELAPHSRDLAMPALREALKQRELADQAAIALHSLDEPADKLIPWQLERLRACQRNDGNEPMQIVHAIVIHGPASKEYAPEVIALLNHKNPDVRRAAAWAAPRMFADETIVISALQAASDDPETKEEAAKSLKMLREAKQ